ncbi:MAG: hypothetical protein QGH51_10435 [Planctomycetota bacterium]|jgi:hypothetical protein|nr:hypothetical protein [Planctomycetota bacterium]MDP6942429.1 hypothetical protein [Planctomycetota bacterium]
MRLIRSLLFFLLLNTSNFAQDSNFGRPMGVQPDFGVVLDSALSTHESEGVNFGLSMLELSASARIDPLGRAYSIIEFPNANEVDIPEAVLIFDGLGDGYEIRAGKMLLDFGKWNTFHNHDLMFPNGDPVRSGLFGGALMGTGLELHRWFAAGDLPVRFSMGAWPSFQAHSHLHEEEHGEEDTDAHGHAGISSGIDGERMSLNHWAYTGRLTSQGDWGPNGVWQFGLSYFGTSAGITSEWENEADPNDPLFADGDSYGLGAQTFGADFSLRSASTSDSSWNSFGLEYWNHSQEHPHAEGNAQTPEIERQEPQGAWLNAEHGFNPSWSAAVHIGWWEAEHEEVLESNYRYGLALNHHLSEFQRLRFAVEQIDWAEQSPDYVLTLQWSGFLGKHRHGLDW